MKDEQDEQEDQVVSSLECVVCHKVETGVNCFLDGLFDFDMYKCKTCGKIFHCDCLEIKPDSKLDQKFIAWFNDETDITCDREEMPDKFCPFCRKH
jgi:hypothetical protein